MSITSQPINRFQSLSLLFAKHVLMIALHAFTQAYASLASQDTFLIPKISVKVVGSPAINVVPQANV